ncbi:MAG: L,D-transpeptidase [Leptolyngbyaceae cyanobacterium SL_5_9]|nr:L,D-transpeptidase [Leptolyngbyaceae cyanobacterium SL_5_9]NJO74133.1 L,D-transpeptidase [Leptolyngbyaceae cyanobacterium RM1_406_9]
MKSFTCADLFPLLKAKIWSLTVTLTLALCGFGVTGVVWAIEPPSEDAEAIATRMFDLQLSSQRWIQIDLSTQRLTAWEGNTPVRAMVISTGKDETPTLTGTFEIQSMHRVARMRGEDYDIPDVPFVMYYSGNYGIHGAYWHNQFGVPMSHGCVNVAVDHAEWLFGWAEMGTSVVVHE